MRDTKNNRLKNDRNEWAEEGVVFLKEESSEEKFFLETITHEMRNEISSSRQ